jgi:pimeloyl-ACP methyl ester carboxylesterase
VSNGQGWLLSLWQTWDPDRLQVGRRPIAIVPGYGMNSFIFSYHPHGVSLEGFLAESGFEVWRADLRGQGGAIRSSGNDDFTMADLALTDLSVVFNAIAERTRTSTDRVDVIGASLGGTLMFIHALLQKNHRMGSLVAMGSPVRWVKVHPVLKFLFGSPLIAGAVRVRGSRKLAEYGLPLLARHVPWVLSIYVNPEASDLSTARELVKTIEDPNRHINRELAVWFRKKDLIVHGMNISDHMRDVTAPVLCIVAGQDGIVPAETATYPYDAVSSKQKELVVVGDETLSMAHADLFISNEVHGRVFGPIRDFFLRNEEVTARREAL